MEEEVVECGAEKGRAGGVMRGMTAEVVVVVVVVAVVVRRSLQRNQMGVPGRECSGLVRAVR